MVQPRIQPPLFELENEPAKAGRAAVMPEAVPAAHLTAVAGAARDRRPRRRYWSLRDLSRRIWLGRGYELVRALINSGILPATRSARAWWVADADVRGLIAAFDPAAGKVRAFDRLDVWLRERCWATPATPAIEALIRATGSGLIWRGTAYLPTTDWSAAEGDSGSVTFRHRRGAAVEPVAPPEQPAPAAGAAPAAA